MTDGIYFSANDVMLPWAVPFLKSFRTFNPHLPLALIPFDENSEKIIALGRQYNFSIFQDSSFASLEKIGEELELGHTSYGKHWFRRYSAFWGIFESFVYLDVRQVVLSDLSAFLKSPRTFDFELVFLDSELNQVYESGPVKMNFLRNGGAKGFNSGRWASTRGLFDLEDFEKSLIAQIPIRDQLNARNTDQAFINFCCDERGLRIAKLSDLFSDVVDSGWARQAGKPYLDSTGVWRLWDHGGNNHKKRIVLLHWAGYVAGDRLPNGNLLKRFDGHIPSKPFRVLRGAMAASRLIRGIVGKR